MSDIDINRIQQNIEQLQDQNAIDFQQWKRLEQEIEKLEGKIKISDCNLNLLIKKIKADYESLKKIMIDENIQLELNNKIEQNKNEINKKVNNETFQNKVDEINSRLDTIAYEKVNESLVNKKIAEAKLEGAGVDTSSLVFRNDIDEELMKAEKRLDLKYERGTIYGNGDFGDDIKCFRSKDAITYIKDTISKIYVSEGFQVSVWRWSNLSENALAVQTFASTTDFTFQANLYYHFVLKRIDASETMLDEEITNVKIITYPNYYFKDKLNEANNKINDLDATTKVLIDSLKTGKKEVELSFVRGTIAGAGVFYDNTKHFRSSTYLKYSENKVLTFDVLNGYLMTLWCYNTEYSNGVNSISITNITSKMDSELKANKYYYLTIKKDGDNDYLVEDSVISNVKIYDDSDFDYKKTQKEILNRLDNLSTSYATKYTDKEDSIVNNVYKVLNSGTIVFGLITDNHCGITNWESCYEHGKILNSLAERVGADFCINLGDIFVDVDDRAENLYRFNEYWKHNNYSFLPNLYCKGNHECFIRSDGKVALEDYQLLSQTQRTNRYINKSNNELYYYFDVRQCRFIVLDSSSNTNCGFSIEHEEFLQEAFNSIGDKKAVIFTHIPLDSSLMLQATPINADKIRNILSINKDKVIAVLHGHTHWDNNAKLDDIEQISFCCAMPGKQDTSSFVGLGSPLSYERSHGTYSEYCMDIVCVDVYSNIVRTFRFGAGSNREILCK